MEHLHHFKLSDDPFRNEPLPGLFVETTPHREALCRLDRAVRQGRGLSLLIGEPGAGKTIAIRQLFESLEEEVFEASMLVVLTPSADGDWLLRRFAAQLGVEDLPSGRDELMSQVVDRLAIVREDGRHAVLIIDDAQSLVAGGALDEVGALLKLEYEDRRLVSIVLAGDASLEAAVSAAPALANRIDVKVRLASLDHDGVAAYVAHRIQRVSGDPAIVDPEALDALRELGRGLPGRMNTLADNALFEAFLCGRDRILRVDVTRAHADLEWDCERDPGAEAVAGAPIPEILSDAIEIESVAPQVVEIPVTVEDSAESVTSVDSFEAMPVAVPVSPSEELPAAVAEFQMHPDSPADLERELEAVFEDATFLSEDEASPLAPAAAPSEHFQAPEAPAFFPEEGPPKQDEFEEVDDLLVELID